MARMGRCGGPPRRAAGMGVFHHFAPPGMTCRFVGTLEPEWSTGELTVEECGVKWSSME